jgi:glutathione S-transferase
MRHAPPEPTMKLYVTPTSPYARAAMIVRLEKGLVDTVELVWTRTRQPDDPLLAVNPSGRIPFLLTDDGAGYEDTDVIVPYLDRLAPPPRFDPPEGQAHWPFRRLQAIARSMLDGVSVWAREVVRPDGEQSPGIIEHERRRAGRLADYFETQVRDPALTGEINMVQILLFCALDVERRLPDFGWRTGRPGLVDWHDRVRDLPSVAGSRPPPGV